MKENIISKHTLIINYGSMKMGGIEKTFASLMRYALKQGYRVIWITNKEAFKEAFIKDISQNENIEKIFYKKHFWSWYTKIEFNKNENVTMLSCEPLMFIRGEQFKSKCKVATFKHFLVLPHFTGNAYYPERFFKNTFLYEYVNKYFYKFARSLNSNNCIYAFSKTHLLNYEENYEIFIQEKNKKVIKAVEGIQPLNHEKIEKRASSRKKEFIIVSCSRLVFPHKGYILGLIDVFEKLKKNYPQSRLIIVGDGPNRNLVDDKIAKLSHEISKDIKLTGTLLPNQLEEILINSHINIGLAGALKMGAKLGVPSLNVRHYTNNCEAYGFIGDKGALGLKTTSGGNAYSFIESMLLCDKETYIDRCYKDYKLVVSSYDVDPDYFFNQEIPKNFDILSLHDIKIAKYIWHLINLIQILFKVPGYENDEK